MDKKLQLQGRKTQVLPWGNHRTTLRMVGGMLVLGWIVGSLMVGALSTPSLLGAAVPEQPQPDRPIAMSGHENPGFSKIANLVRPAVVHIAVVKKSVDPLSGEFFERMPNLRNRDSSPFPHGRGMGSGVIVSPEGYVVTNNHVVEGATSVTVTLPDKRQFTGKVIGSDPPSDLAVLKIEGKELPYLVWGDSSSLKVGDYVLAVGNPFGLNSTVTQGIVSALGRGGMGITRYEDFIQTDAAINPGNSGGALVDGRGQLVGINTAIISRTGGYQGVGFAVPSAMAQPVFQSLQKNGKVVRGYLGVGIQEITPDLARTFDLEKAAGALVTDVKPGSPADEARLKRGDTIVGYQGQFIGDPRALQREVLQTPIGTKVKIVVVRNGEEQELSTTILEQAKSHQLAQGDFDSEGGSLAGVRVEPLTPFVADKLGLGNTTEGVVVTAVDPGSPADRAGLVRGDVIGEVNRQVIHSMDDYQRMAESAGKNQVDLLLIYRAGTSLYLTVKV